MLRKINLFCPLIFLSILSSLNPKKNIRRHKTGCCGPKFNVQLVTSARLARSAKEPTLSGKQGDGEKREMICSRRER